MARLKRCDLCGAEADELMSIDFPYEERWMLFFHKRSLAHYADLCLDCLEKIRAERQAQIKANEVDFEVADTPQTESTGSPIGDYRDGVGAWQTEPVGCVKDWSSSCTSCERYFSCDYLSGRRTDCDDRYAVRTDSGEVVAYACPLGCEQTDCGWK